MLYFDIYIGESFISTCMAYNKKHALEIASNRYPNQIVTVKPV